MRKLVLTTGGTGGHVFPALALAEELKRRNSQTEILFIGSAYGPEKRLVEQAGIPFEALPVRGFLGRGLKAIPAAINLGLSLLLAMNIMRKFKPDAIAGFGGYASFAPAFVATMQGIPLLLHEQNAIAGSANKFLGSRARSICVSLPETSGFNKSVIFTGNPVRAIIRKAGYLRSGKKNKKLRLLVLGGSQGAHALNMFIAENLSQLKAQAEIRLQTGISDLERLQKVFISENLPAESVQAFIDDMAQAYSWADVILCRAGASTCAEVCAAGLPAILVPFPAAIHDHQTLNAQTLVNSGAAILVPEAEISRVTDLLKKLAVDDGLLARMSEAAFALGKCDAAGNIANEIEKIWDAA